MSPANMKYACLLVTSLLAFAAAQQCNPAGNCQLPDCRCFLDTTTPGGFAKGETPQIVVITMDYVLNEEYEPLYNQIFNVNNPNNCQIRGTFYIQDSGTNYALVKRYYDNGFEIGINSVDGSIPQDQQAWIDMIKDVKSKLQSAGIDVKDVRGLRPAQLSIGSNEEFTALGDEDLLYDASCVTDKYNQEDLFKWPFTYDFPPSEENLCTTGNPPDNKYPGKWEVIISDLTWKDTKCASPASCTEVTTKKEAFDLLYNNFASHYEGNRAPFIVVIDPSWLKVDYKLEGTVEFVDYIRAAFADTWIVTAYQMLQWVQNPVNASSANDFDPWKC